MVDLSGTKARFLIERDGVYYSIAEHANGVCVVDIETRAADVLVLHGGDLMHGEIADKTTRLDEGNRQLMAYAAGLDYGLTEMRVIEHMMADSHIAEFGLMDIAINDRERFRDIMIKKAVDSVRPLCLEGSRPGKRKKRRDWDQRDRKYRGR